MVIKSDRFKLFIETVEVQLILFFSENIIRANACVGITEILFKQKQNLYICTLNLQTVTKMCLEKYPKKLYYEQMRNETKKYLRPRAIGWTISRRFSNGPFEF